ncbi:MAG: tyrosine-type recombinase/integrase [bacterium]|nr:tyrosine-type recombinase/integrase [bacterium]
MNMSIDLGMLLSKYFLSYLPGVRSLSANTIASYRDTFNRLLLYCTTKEKLSLETLSLEQLDRDLILRFLDWLETEQHCCAATRNQRLAVVKSFFKFATMETVSALPQFQTLSKIPLKRTPHPEPPFLTEKQLKLLFKQPDMSTIQGRKDLCLMNLLYDSGARVQEVLDLTLHDIRLGSSPVVRLTGKGMKTRSIPMSRETARFLSLYVAEHHMADLPKGTSLFYSHFKGQHSKMVRSSVNCMLKKYGVLAKVCDDSFPERIGPHLLRHTRAMHLLQAGVALTYVRDILGHVDIRTTDIYARADIEMKRKALKSMDKQFLVARMKDWTKEKKLLDQLCRIGSSSAVIM